MSQPGDQENYCSWEIRSIRGNRKPVSNFREISVLVPPLRRICDLSLSVGYTLSPVRSPLKLRDKNLCKHQPGWINRVVCKLCSPHYTNYFDIEIEKWDSTAGIRYVLHTTFSNPLTWFQSPRRVLESTERSKPVLNIVQPMKTTCRVWRKNWMCAKPPCKSHWGIHFGPLRLRICGLTLACGVTDTSYTVNVP